MVTISARAEELGGRMVHPDGALDDRGVIVRDGLHLVVLLRPGEDLCAA